MSQSAHMSDDSTGTAAHLVVSAICDWWVKSCVSSKGESSRLVIAVSGGIDSLALLRGFLLVSQLDVWRQDHGFPEKSDWLIAHFNHQVRGQAADDDALWVKQLAVQEQLYVRKGDRQTEAGQGAGEIDHASISEEALRRSRYDFLRRVAEEHQAKCIVLAHHADDQAETVLHHLLRGSSFSGLAGMRRSQPFEPSLTLERPLLGLNKSTLRQFLLEIGQDWREDRTNSETVWTRNALRQLVLPALDDALVKMGIRRTSSQSLLQLAKHSQEVETHLQNLADELLKESVLECGFAKFQVAPWRKRQPIVQREAFKQIWIRNQWPRKDLAARHLERLCEFLGDYKQPLSGDFPGGIRMTRRRDWFSLTPINLEESPG
ncbi:tRNA lysidine(34) synthetase TilS [Planctopirus ephydatiae]|nr:tRNA lysidine(34) synthetase TilS [Planctopirus ephydatiae]